MHRHSYEVSFTSAQRCKENWLIILRNTSSLNRPVSERAELHKPGLPDRLTNKAMDKNLKIYLAAAE